MPYKLYSHDGSGGFVVEAGLVKARQDYEVITIDTVSGQQNAPAFAGINPMKQVPVLVLPDGTLMTESAAMAIYLVDKYHEHGLGPMPGTSAHAEYLRWIVFMTINLYEADLRFHYTDRYTDDPAGEAGVDRAARAHMLRGIQTMDGVLRANGGFVLRGGLTLADVYLAMVSIWYPDEHKCAAVKANTEAVKADPDYGPIWSRHFGER